MTVREYLRRPEALRREILRRRARIGALRELASRLTFALQEVSVRSSPDPTRMQELLAEAADEEREVLRLEKGLEQSLADTALYISCLPDERLIRVLQLRYLELYDWPEISLRMGYCASGTFALHSRALRLLPPPPADPPP